MLYSYEFSPVLDKQLRKTKKKDIVLFDKILKKVLQVIQKPELYKVLQHVGGKYRRVHVGSFVLLFTIQDDKVIFLSIEHHDDAYKNSS